LGYCISSEAAEWFKKFGVSLSNEGTNGDQISSPESAGELTLLSPQDSRACISFNVVKVNLSTCVILPRKTVRFVQIF
jgi:hypothetical protein